MVMGAEEHILFSLQVKIEMMLLTKVEDVVFAQPLTLGYGDCRIKAGDKELKDVQYEIKSITGGVQHHREFCLDFDI